MSRDPIQLYLRALKRRLWLRGILDPESLAEVESHLLESAEAGLRRGLSEEEAEKQAVERFGSVRAITSAFETERKNTMQTILLLVSALTGLFFAYVDSRPTWDDTGILAFSILIVSGLIVLLGYRRPWLAAPGNSKNVSSRITTLSETTGGPYGPPVVLFIFSSSECFDPSKKLVQRRTKQDCNQNEQE